MIDLNLLSTHPSAEFETVLNLFQTHQIDLVGISPVNSQQGWYTLHQQRLQEWIDRGDFASMEWMTTQLQARLYPETLLPNAQSAVVLWLNHFFPLPEKPSYPTARVARYAWGRDYHSILRKVLRKAIRSLKKAFPHENFHGSVDTSPVLERAFGQQAHVGWIGKSTLLIHPRLGTYGSLAVLLTTLKLPTALKAHPNRCGTCEACWEICPTQALSSQGLDARKCISYWTIEHRGLIPRSMRPLIEDWFFGCDLCQEICPWNHKASSPSEEQRQIWQPQDDRIWPDLKKWLTLEDEELNQNLFGSPLRRAFPHGLKRNALIVLANQSSFESWEEIKRGLDHPFLSVQLTALWALVDLLTHQRHKTRRDTLDLSWIEQQCTFLLDYLYSHSPWIKMDQIDPDPFPLEDMDSNLNDLQHESQYPFDNPEQIDLLVIIEEWQLAKENIKQYMSTVLKI